MRVAEIKKREEEKLKKKSLVLDCQVGTIINDVTFHFERPKGLETERPTQRTIINFFTSINKKEETTNARAFTSFFF